MFTIDNTSLAVTDYAGDRLNLRVSDPGSQRSSRVIVFSVAGVTVELTAADFREWVQKLNKLVSDNHEVFNAD